MPDPQQPTYQPGERVRFLVTLGVQNPTGGVAIFTGRAVNPGDTGTVLDSAEVPVDAGLIPVRPDGDAEGFVPAAPTMLEAAGGGSSEAAS